jgi:hypothetical protein
MSLIFGLNLSDRIYLSGDTRLTQKTGDTITETKDKIIKSTPFTQDIAAVFAGNAAMAAFVSKELIEIIKPGLDIRTFRADIESYLAPVINKYWEDNGAKTSMAIIFGGLNRNAAKKPLTPKQVYDLAMALNEAEPGASMNMKPAMFRDVMRKEGEDLRYPESVDSHVFSVQIFPPNGFVVQDAEWGEYLAHGAGGITKENLDPSITARVEFGGAAGQDNAMISAVLNDVVYRTKEPTIGGAFFTLIVNEEITGAVLGRIVRINVDTKEAHIVSEIIEQNGSLYSRNASGILEPLTMLHQYGEAW